MKKIRLITNIISVILMSGYIVFLAVKWRSIPETVPTHFDAMGQPDAWGSKVSLIAEPIFMAALFFVLVIAERFPSAWNFPVKVTADNRNRLYSIGYSMMGAMKILVVCVFIDIGLSSIIPEFPVWPLYLLMILIAIAVITGIIASARAR